MSGEFGEYGGTGYFHSKIQSAAEDCLGSGNPMTKAVGALLTALCPLAHAVSWHEACDSGPETPVEIAIQQRHALRAALHEIESVTDPARQVARDAVLATNRDRFGIPKWEGTKLTVTVPRMDLPEGTGDLLHEALVVYVRDWTRSTGAPKMFYLCSWGGPMDGHSPITYCFTEWSEDQEARSRLEAVRSCVERGGSIAEVAEILSAEGDGRAPR